MKILIGSQAIKEQAEDFYRSPKDKDFLASSYEAPGPGEDLVRAEHILCNYRFTGQRATLDEIFTLKISHSPWLINDLMTWQKHLKDIQWLKNRGCQVNEQLYRFAYQQWEFNLGKKNISLAKSKEEFFNNSVERYYEHDSVHDAVALGGEPGFKKILAPGEEVKTSEKAWNELSFKVQQRLATEEVMVLSLERDLIPAFMNKNTEPTKEEIYVSYRKQLRLLITQYSKGYFARWLIENYFSIIDPPLNYWALFQDSDRKKTL